MNCDRIAPWYRALEYVTFGRMLERRRFAYLDQVAGARRVLILGDGDGRFTAQFVMRYPAALVDSIDLSAGMLELAKRRTGAGGSQVRFHAADARSFSLEGKYDLVVTHFFLDCFADGDLAQLAARVTGHCEPGARWLVSEFALPDRGVARFAARGLLRLMYFFFFLATGLSVTRLPNYAQVLRNNGFRLESRETALKGFLVSELWTS
jgi:ubiquinone/menaquinone biosynthesis C-methylase UbiE